MFLITMKVTLVVTEEMNSMKSSAWAAWAKRQPTVLLTQVLDLASPHLILVPFLHCFLLSVAEEPNSEFAKNYTSADVNHIEFHRGRFSLCSPASVNLSQLQRTPGNKHYLQDGGLARAKQLLSSWGSAVSRDPSGLFASPTAAAMVEFHSSMPLPLIRAFKKN